MGQRPIATTKPTRLDEWRLEHAREQREDAVDGTGLQQSVSIVDVK